MGEGSPGMPRKTKEPDLGISLVGPWLRLHAPKAGVQVQPPVRELDPTCCNQEFTCMPWQRWKIPCAATKTCHSQINSFFFFFLKNQI